MQPDAIITVPTPAGPTQGILSAVPGALGGVVMVDGAGGGLYGPSSIYPLLTPRLQAAGIAALRLDYRRPNVLAACVQDTLAGIALLDAQGVTAVVLIGWSFGGAVAIKAGVMGAAVAGVATIASQTFGTDDVGRLAPKRLLLIHGTADAVLPPSCSQDLYRRAHQPKELVFFEGDGHGIERHTQDMLALLLDWCGRTLAPPPVAGA
jgi:pimeloyl-ACP methyl ester carboxylesterase